MERDRKSLTLRKRASAMVTIVSLLGGGTGCSVVVRSGEEQCTVDADCAARGPSFDGMMCIDNLCQPKPDPIWGCIGNVPPPTAGATRLLHETVIDLLTRQPVKDVAIKLCAKQDPSCAAPLETLAQDADGYFSVKVAESFDGYFDIQKDGYVPTMLFVAPGTGQHDVENAGPSIFRTGIVEGLFANSNATLDPDKGILFFHAENCLGQPSNGVHFEIFPSGQAIGFYLFNNLGDLTLTETDTSGVGGFFNVTPGTVVGTATIGVNGREIKRSNTFVRKGTITFNSTRPGPTP